MRRRAFIPSLAGAVAAPASAPLLKPRVLRPGDTVGLVTPGTWVPDPDRVALARHTVEFLGLKWKQGRTVGRRESSLAAGVKERVADLHDMFQDPEVKAVFCVRGGYGASRLLDSIDYALLRRHPKLFIGYSDITALHLAIHQSAGLVTFHGPILLSSFPDYTLEHFRRAIFDARPLGKLTNPPEGRPIRPRHPIRTLRGGKARGPLTGGNLSLICATMGTPWEIQPDGRILFLEDTDEQPYSMDRMLTHLRLAGKFRNIRGLVLGECEGCKARDFQPSTDSPYSLGEVLDGILGDLTVPVVSGLTIGHTDDQMTLPLGVSATLDANEGSLTIEESALTE
jgi:muramoyltetrapeptide carboxypeptidase